MAKVGPRRVTVSAVAQRARVSRQFIYSHPDLKTAVDAAGRSHQPSITDGPARTDVEAGLLADRGTLVAKINRQRTTLAELRARVADLERQRQRWLGDQLLGQEAITPEEHSELRLTVNRLMSDKETLRRTVEQLRRVNGVLEAELAASREAHTTDVARFGLAVATNVKPIVPSRPPSYD